MKNIKSINHTMKIQIKMTKEELTNKHRKFGTNENTVHRR